MPMGSFWQCSTYSFSSNAAVGVAREEEAEIDVIEFIFNV